MSNRSDIHDRLASSLREARRARGLSLDAVAKLSGVSRSMVSQIERGESSPTVATLWNLTQALQVDFAGLLEGKPRPGIEITRADAAPVIDRGGVRIRILSPPEAVGENEVYDLEFSPGARLLSEPHSPGCREHLTVIDGQLRVRSGDEDERLGAGDVARYAADRDHEIGAEGSAPARAILIVQGS
ncbi:helix-turn-helix domain-containing protein [Pseudogemmobacter blasticus]|uniref:XRE family transcriptional regulator n=1 Tax=Fuscovulum blasticum DSM 2131 TaxID=1188250 RepID=A0A2T4J5T6_FUSBL|nr:helix-turn-helix domain-containing protein [Fuscovulum blasticum]PTE13262.1 XRE family transcriptional regulator [Fuscovulum blasticum DSM 2131]